MGCSQSSVVSDDVTDIKTSPAPGAITSTLGRPAASNSFRIKKEEEQQRLNQSPGKDPSLSPSRQPKQVAAVITQAQPSPNSANNPNSNNKKGWKKKKGGNGNTPVPPPLTARPRTDTWEINQSNSSSSMRGVSSSNSMAAQQQQMQQQQQQQQQQRQLQNGYVDGNSSHSKTRSMVILDNNNNNNNNSSHTRPKSPAAMSLPLQIEYTVQDQWKLLWETQSPHLVDPADVPAVLDTLLDKTVNRLSPVQITFLQRRIRLAVNRLYTKKQGKDNTGMKLKVFAAAGGGGGGSSAQTAAAETSEAKAVLEKSHLLTEALLRQILPKTSSAVMSVFTNAVQLMLAMSNTSAESALWDRASFAAKAAAETAKLEMDVNKKKNNWSMPKPSQVPVLEGGAHYPPGVTFTALAAIVSLALSPKTRAQRLQLLFFLCMQPDTLQTFLASHPAGGVPMWLLEVDNDCCISLASLTHYHYYGHAFLPTHVPTPDELARMETNSDTKDSGKFHVLHPFVPSRSRRPLSLPFARISKIVQSLLDLESQRANQIMEQGGIRQTKKDSSGHGSNRSGNGRKDAGVSGSFTDMNGSVSSITNNTIRRKNSSANDSITGENNNDMQDGNSIFPMTDVMERLLEISDGGEPDIYCYPPESASLVEVSRQHFLNGTEEFLTIYGVASELSLEAFGKWADLALDDLALNIVFHKLFGEGILPSPALERELVLCKWLEWQQAIQIIISDNVRQDKESNGGNGETPSGTGGDDESFIGSLSQSVQALINPWKSEASTEQLNGILNFLPPDLAALQQNNLNEIMPYFRVHGKGTFVWGGLGNVDGGGGMGYGVLYCIGKEWWDAWVEYSGWSFLGESYKTERYGKIRPGCLATDNLLEDDHDSIIRGSMGSYEVMKHGLKRNADYVLVPPGVWDILYEIYGGGPPLPRMIRSPERKFSDTNRNTSNENLDEIVDREKDEAMERSILDELRRNSLPRAMNIPDGLSVELHPWILHVHLCDPLQPYRRGETGPMSIRVMVTPDQPLWRVYAEIICRFSYQPFKAFASDGRGKARLWKKNDPGQAKESVTRYGPWNLLCKSRHAILPMMAATGYGVEGFMETRDELIANWKQFADNATVETGGLNNHDQLMLEFAVQNKNGELAWPREAAAKAGRVRRLAEEDRKFRNLLQGLSEDGNIMLKPPSLVGLEVDAMDSTGRWYTVRILDVEFVDDDTDEDLDDDIGAKEDEQPMSRKKVKVFFKEHGGHTEWIDVESDRLATAGRFASQTEQEGSESSTAQNNAPNPPAENKTKAVVPPRKNSTNTENAENTKMCTLPGLGACGLTNLGNTCYQNSPLQCLGYTPIVRSYLLSGQYKVTGDINKDNFLGSGGKLLEETADLLRFMWSARLGEKSPTRFRTQLAKLNPQFSGADQQDAQEFLNYIIDALHEDSYKDKKKPYVEPLEDHWVKITALPRVGDEAWRRFLRRNRSFMADMAMGQSLNTVTCPVCNYSSRNFDPFNLLSIPIPTVADVIFQCTVYRRATSLNCPWVLDRVRKGDKRASRYSMEGPDSESGPPSEHFVAEQYVIALSRLADSGDLRLQIQNLTGIRANQLRLCRAEEVVVNTDAKDGSPVRRQMKVFPLSDKDGPASQHAKKKGPNDETKAPTQIIAFETTLNPRVIEGSKGNEKLEEAEEEEENGDEIQPSPKMAEIIERHLEVYGDDKECRLVDTDALVIAKSVSRSLWPRSEDELKLGLRVDAMDHRGNWFPGSVIEILDDNGNGGDADTGEEVELTSKRVRVHFDNFSPKWDEMYSIDHFKQGRVKPLYSHAVPKRKPTEFLVHNRHTDRLTGQLSVFGQSFYVQCQNEWSNARAGAHILAQVSRFMQYKPGLNRISNDPDARDYEAKAQKLYEKTQSVISDLIDLLVDCDREYVRLALGVSQHNKEEEKTKPFRNPTFDASSLSSALVKKVSGLLQRLPFEVRICTVEGAHSDKPSANAEEVSFPFSLVRTIGNFMNIKHAVFLQWRNPTIEKQTPSVRTLLRYPVMYVEPKVHVHESSAQLMNESASGRDNKKKNTAGSAGIDLGFCLTEFCKVQKLSIQDNWKCPVCKVHREGAQNMDLWRLPDLLTFHIKRFNMSARWHEKITTKVNFPLTGLDMSEWCHKESPVIQEDSKDSCVYDLIGVVNHYGSMTGGHYVATCKASACGRDGREEVAYSFNGVGATTIETEGSDAPSGWRLGRPKQEVNPHKVAAAMASKAASESAEPMWLQFDDEVVEPIPPRYVVSEMAYVLFYRRRRISPSNIAKYSTLE